MWLGHLGVEVGRHVCDPSASQWYDGSSVVVEKPAGWDDVGRWPAVAPSGVEILKYHRQHGWKSKPASARRRWQPEADAAMRALTAAEKFREQNRANSRMVLARCLGGGFDSPALQLVS